MIPPIQVLDASFASPAQNLACDEALLDELESGHGFPCLRFWESATPFVVVGYGNQIAAEVNRPSCERLGVPILRRSSGGGAVVQAFGSLNYNLTLPITDETVGITETNCFIMRRQRDALARLLGAEVRIQGHTDLTLGPFKFSGNAQRRKKSALVFHGCFLLAEFDLALIDQLLLHPSREPDYRARRPHADFLTRLEVSRSDLKTALASAWSASDLGATISHLRMESLVRERYANQSWTEKH